MENKVIVGGIYRHYKSKEMLYEVIAEAINSETLEEMVIYKSLYKHGEYDIGTIWARPKALFVSKVPEDAKNTNNQVYRFEYIGEKEK